MKKQDWNFQACTQYRRSVIIMVIILKIGGGKGVTDNLDKILDDVATIKEKIIIVHGANHEMKEISEALGHPEQIVKSPGGYTSRFTDEKTLEIFMMVYSGVANKRIVTKLQKLGVNAIGLSGMDGKLLVGKRKDSVKVIEGNKIKLLRGNFTGTVEEVNGKLLNLLLEKGYTPVICPPAISYEGDGINTDNDRIVAAIAGAMEAEKIVSLFEAPGLLRDHTDESTLIKKIDKSEVMSMIEHAKGRMKKKILHAKEAFDKGAGTIYFGDARIEKPVTSALEGKGTIIG